MFELVKNNIAQKRNNEKGFTLVELLVVIVILGVLAAIVVFAVGGITNKGETAACKTDRKAIQTAEEAYFAQNATYVNEAALVPLYLHEASELYNVTGTATGYAGTIQSASCGTVGAAW